MTDYFTIKLPEEDGERHNERRKELGLTWAEYIEGNAPEGTDMEQVLGRLDDLESSIPNKTADELMGRINR